MPDYTVSLDTLTARYDRFADGTEQGDSRPLYDAILSRLADNRRMAEVGGWTDCALERTGGGHLHLTGRAPGASDRIAVPDLAHGGH